MGGKNFWGKVRTVTESITLFRMYKVQDETDIAPVSNLHGVLSIIVACSSCHAVGALITGVKDGGTRLRVLDD